MMDRRGVRFHGPGASPPHSLFRSCRSPGLNSTNACGMTLTDRSSPGSSRPGSRAVEAATCPPAEPPPATTRSGSTPRLAAWLRTQRMADLPSAMQRERVGPVTRFCAVLGADRNHAAQREILRVRVELRGVAAGPAAAEEEDNRRAAVAWLPTRRTENVQLEVRALDLLVDQLAVRGRFLSRRRRLQSGDHQSAQEFAQDPQRSAALDGSTYGPSRSKTTRRNSINRAAQSHCTARAIAKSRPSSLPR